MLYECLTGETPYPGNNLEQQITAHLTAPPPRPSSADPHMPVGFDGVIAAGMAKNPDQRYPSTVELARAARGAITTPIAAAAPASPFEPVAPHAHWPTADGASTAAPTQLRPTPPATDDRSPVDNQHPSAAPSRRLHRRAGIIVGTVLAAVLVVAAGIFAVVKLSSRPAGPNASQPATAISKPLGPLDGTFSAEFGQATSLEGKPTTGPPENQIWSIRSACPASGCVATASRVGVSDKSKLLTMVLDEIDGQWLAVAVIQQKCGTVDTEFWATYTLQLRPDRTLSGEQSITSACANQKAPVTFTRTGDVFPGVPVADPGTQPPRVASPAEGLHGRYHNTVTWTNGAAPQDHDFGVRTNCLRTGERCISYFHGPEGSKMLMFANAKWTRTEEFDSPCSAGGTSHAKIAAEFLLPQPPQDPITMLTGHGHLEATGSACAGGDFDDKFVRTGD